MFCDDLLVQFHDLTWIEEKICAIYCVTAHVTQLFQSADSVQLIFHENMCVHDMNVISTALILPHTLIDVNGLLSVIFVGPREFNPKILRTILYVCWSKIWAFLVWLRHHNYLYSSISLDAEIAALYTKNNILPSALDGIIKVYNLDVWKVLEKETAGFFKYPADILSETSVLTDIVGAIPVIMLKEMVSQITKVTKSASVHVLQLLFTTYICGMVTLNDLLDPHPWYRQLEGMGV